MTREEAIVVLKAFMDNPLFSDVHRATFSIAIHDIKQRHEWDINKLMLVSKTEWEQEPTTKNDLGVDCVARQDIERYIEGFINEYTPKEELEFINLELDGLKHLPSVTPQEPVLDKIRAEIKKSSHGKWYVGRLDGKTEEVLLLDEVLQIIDKYKGDRSEKETETWNGIHAQITVPKGTFDKIFNDTEEDIDDI